MTSEANSATAIAAVDELGFLADSLRRVDAATAAAHWDDDALVGVIADAQAELTAVRQTASTELLGGQWAAFLLVLGSAMTSWLLLTVFAVTCSREPWIRRILSREMVVYRRGA